MRSLIERMTNDDVIRFPERLSAPQRSCFPQMESRSRNGVPILRAAGVTFVRDASTALKARYSATKIMTMIESDRDDADSVFELQASLKLKKGSSCPSCEKGVMQPDSVTFTVR